MFACRLAPQKDEVNSEESMSLKQQSAHSLPYLSFNQLDHVHIHEREQNGSSLTACNLATLSYLQVSSSHAAATPDLSYYLRQRATHPNA